MRSASRLALLLALPLGFACGDDSGGDDGSNTTAPTTSVGNDDSGTAATDPTGATDPTNATDPTTTDPTNATDPSDSSGGGGMGPTINSISWAAAAGCMMGTGGDYDITVDVTDPDNDASEITLSGMLIGCTGEVDAPMVTLVCPNAAPYTGTITATDPDGNEDDLEITIEPCVDGSAP